MTIKMEYKPFNSFPDAFDDLKELEPMEFMQFLFSIVDFYTEQLKSIKKEFNFINIEKIKVLIQKILDDKEEELLKKRHGATTISDIIKLLFLTIKLQINVRDREVIEEDNDCVQLILVLKYILTLESVAKYKFNL